MKLPSRCSTTHTVQNCPNAFSGGAMRRSLAGKMSSYLNIPSPSNYDACIPEPGRQYSMNIKMIDHWTMNVLRLVTDRSVIMIVSWPCTTCRGRVPTDSGAPRIGQSCRRNLCFRNSYHAKIPECTAMLWTFHRWVSFPSQPSSSLAETAGSKTISVLG